MKRPIDVFVLTTLAINPEGQVVGKNVGISFDLFEAEVHRGLAVENDFERYPIPADWLEAAEQSNFVAAMREFREIVVELQAAALR